MNFTFHAEHLLWSEFSEMVRIRTILQISVRIWSEFAQKVRFFQFQSLLLPRNPEKEAHVCLFHFPSSFTQPCDILGQHFHFLYQAGPVLPDTTYNLAATSPLHRAAPDKTELDAVSCQVKVLVVLPALV